ncbi:MAG: hypothetical protein R2702_18915 [Acidimicrobiales bacterium]
MHHPIPRARALRSGRLLVSPPAVAVGDPSIERLAAAIRVALLAGLLVVVLILVGAR